MLMLTIAIVSCLIAAGGALMVLRQRRVPDRERGLDRLGAVSTQWLQGHRAEEP